MRVMTGYFMSLPEKLVVSRVASAGTAYEESTLIEPEKRRIYLQTLFYPKDHEKIN
jgi:hypothetical protein